MKHSKEVTIYDIARKLNISPATVSRGLQDHPAISKKTKKKIAEMVDELGYRTNHFASNLRKRSTKTIGVIVHELKSNFITSVLSGIEKIATEAGYDLIIAHSSENVAKEKANAKNLFHKRVDGLIASLSFSTTDTEHFKPYMEKKVPVIFFDRVEQDGNNTVVIIDNSRCGYIATKHLADQGCRKIVLVTSDLKRNVYSERYNGYKNALADHGINFDETLVLINDLSERAGIDSAKQILQMDPLPDGAFITNDFVAAVCIRVLKQNGISVPGDIAIVGFNNDAIGSLIEPELTTINYPGNDIGEIAAKNLISYLEGSTEINKTYTITLPSELIIRKSSLKRGLLND